MGREFHFGMMKWSEDSDGCAIIMWMYLMPLNYTLKTVRMVDLNRDMLSEMSKTNTMWFHLHVESNKQNKWKSKTKSNWHRLVVVRGKSGLGVRQNGSRGSRDTDFQLYNK